MYDTIVDGKRQRVNYKGAIFHITMRCNNGERLFIEEEDYKKYEALLARTKLKFGFLLHDYTIMSNHVHLIIRLMEMPDVSKIMQSVNRQFAFWYNRTHGKRGHFWEDRFYATPIADDMYLLATMRYAELNPVRAGLCNHPVEWHPSGARHYHQGNNNDLIDHPEIYLELGMTDKARRKAYSQIFPINLAIPIRLKA